MNNRHAKDSILRECVNYCSVSHLSYRTYFEDKENNDSNAVLHHRIQCVGEDHYVDDPEYEHEGDQPEMVDCFWAGIWQLVNLQGMRVRKGSIYERILTASIRSDKSQWKHLINSNWRSITAWVTLNWSLNAVNARNISVMKYQLRSWSLFTSFQSVRLSGVQCRDTLLFLTLEVHRKIASVHQYRILRLPPVPR